MVRSSIAHCCFAAILLNETTGADVKPGGEVMELHGKKAQLFSTGEVFPFNIGLLMNAVCLTLEGKNRNRKMWYVWDAFKVMKFAFFISPWSFSSFVRVNSKIVLGKFI